MGLLRALGADIEHVHNVERRPGENKSITVEIIP
jgi:hypothetical protein